MYRRDDLLRIAEESEAAYERLSATCPPGAVSKERNTARQRLEDALAVAEWMERNGIDQLRFPGPFGTGLPRKGQKVVLPAGTRFKTTDPRYRGDGGILKRRQTITVHDVFPGYIDRWHPDADGHPRIVSPQLQWTGGGGYWRWCALEDAIY